MDYKEVVFKVEPRDPWCDLLIEMLAEIGYESFQQTEQGCKAYITSDLFDESKLININPGMPLNKKVDVKYQLQDIEDINWNEEWEKNYEPVIINNKCYIRAPFHPPKENIPFEIIIEPKMSFGTGHHRTTSLIAEYLLEADFKGKDVLDMGCGTGVLAIIAAKRGAKNVTAIDNHIYAFENTIENMNNNNVKIKVIHGDKGEIGNQKFDVIIVNITKNTIIEDIKEYCEALNQEGVMFMSGFFEKDIVDIEKKAKELGMEFVSKRTRDRWASIKLHKS